MNNYKTLHSQRKSESININDVRELFPDNDSVLEHIFNARYGKQSKCAECDNNFKYYRIKKRKQYACAWCGNQISPLADTIMHKSSTPLVTWIYAAYEIGIAKNGISALELQRKIGTTYKTAWRMLHKIRNLMNSSGASLLDGTVEIDEAFIGKRATNSQSAIIGAVDRQSNATRLEHIETVTPDKITDFVNRNVYKEGATVYTDGNPVYKRMGLKRHEYVIHGKGEFRRGDVHTLTIDKLWGQIKRSIKGTYTSVSLKYLQKYLDEFAFRRSLIGRQVFPALLRLLPNVAETRRR